MHYLVHTLLILRTKRRCKGCVSPSMRNSLRLARRLHCQWITQGTLAREKEANVNEKTVKSEKNPDVKTSAKLRLARETVKALTIRTGVRTGRPNTSFTDLGGCDPVS
jgi:hypothetical protein